MAREVNFDGLVGPTHHYGGLSHGNRASMEHGREVSHPRKAALQGLKKMKQLMDTGIPQAILPPHPRPHIPTLREAGFNGTTGEVLNQALTENPELLSAVYSASAMWAANVATVSPVPDTASGQLHITPANLLNQRHRRIEPPVTTRFLGACFDDVKQSRVHDPLETNENLTDEGAANHMRLSSSHGEPGLEIFVYGREDADDEPTEQYPARQTLEASKRIASNHGLDAGDTLFLQQHPEAIDAGVFHNDVAAVTNENVLFYHENAYENPGKLTRELNDRFGTNGHEIKVSESEIPLETAVETYLFNSQLVTQPNGSMLLLATAECETNSVIRNFIEETLIPADHPIDDVRYIDVRQSMKNGGGPACLRLRVVLTDEQFNQLPNSVQLTPGHFRELIDWVKQHYRTELSIQDLGDRKLYRESREAIADLWDRLQLGSIIPFDQYWEGPLD